MGELLGIEYFADPQRRVFIPYLLISMVMAWAMMTMFKLDWRQAIGFRIWNHPSSILDYKMFFLNSVLKVLLIAPLVPESAAIIQVILFELHRQFGYIEALRYPKWIVVSLYTITMFVLNDLSRYGLHRLMHEKSWLWQFHKVHHSAEVLNPLTFYRVHPVESFLFGLRYAIVAGSITAVFLYLFGARLGVFEIGGVQLSVLLGALLGANLRHSHVAMRFPGWMEAIFISPAQHQLHHTTMGTKLNYGGIFSLWDGLFGTLKRSSGRENRVFGLGPSQRGNFETVRQLYFRPFMMLRKRLEG